MHWGEAGHRLLACSVRYCNAIFHHHFIFPPIICMTFKTLQSGGQLLLGFNYKLTRGHISSLHALAYYSGISDQCWATVRGQMMTQSSNKSGQCNKYDSGLCPILISIGFLKRRFYYKDELIHPNPLMIQPIPLNPKQRY